MSFTVRTYTGIEYKLEKKVYAQMNGLMDLITVYRGKDGKRVNVLNKVVNNKAFKKAVEFCKYHMNDLPTTKKTEADDIKSLDMSSWDKKFIKMEIQELLDLVELADMLDIQKLMVVVCKGFTAIKNSMSIEELSKTFNIVDDDIADMHKKNIKEENKWQRDNRGFENLY